MENKTITEPSPPASSPKTHSPSPHQNQPPTLPPLLFSPQILPLSSSLCPPRPSFPPTPPHLAKQNSCSNPSLEFFGLHIVAPSPSSSQETNKPNSRPLVLIFFSSRLTGSHHRPLPPTGVKTIHGSTARSATRSRGEEDETHDKLTRSEADPKKEKAEKRGRSKKKNRSRFQKQRK